MLEGYALRSNADHIYDPALKSIRAKRGVVDSVQGAGELQYLENNFENHLNHTVKTFCRMFNDHNEILEILLKENPKRFIQKALNHNAIDVKLIKDDIIEVTFCKEINNNLIEFTDLNAKHGFIPIKIKTYNDKIWYLKDNVITNEISSKMNEISNVKTIELREDSGLPLRNNYYLQFLNDKLILKEHIFNNRTNIEEELLNEMKQLSNVGIELKENEQNSMVPHEIINDLDSFFETYWLKYWRIYVIVGVTLVYIFIVRSLIYIVSPYFLLNKRNKNLRRIQLESVTSQVKDEKIGLNLTKRKVNLTEFPSITSLNQE
jgi:hypothetical protein